MEMNGNKFPTGFTKIRQRDPKADSAWGAAMRSRSSPKVNRFAQKTSRNANGEKKALRKEKLEKSFYLAGSYLQTSALGV